MEARSVGGGYKIVFQKIIVRSFLLKSLDPNRARAAGGGGYLAEAFSMKYLKNFFSRLMFQNDMKLIVRLDKYKEFT